MGTYTCWNCSWQWREPTEERCGTFGEICPRCRCLQGCPCRMHNGRMCGRAPTMSLDFTDVCPYHYGQLSKAVFRAISVAYARKEYAHDEHWGRRDLTDLADIAREAMHRWNIWQKPSTKASVPSRSRRKGLSQRLRFAVLERDGFRCRYCGRTPPDINLHVDHVIAVANGGDDDFGNLVASCADCNLGKSTSTLRAAVMRSRDA